MKSVIILKSRGNPAFLCNAVCKDVIYFIMCPRAFVYHMNIILHGHPKDQRDECEHIKGTLNLCFSRLTIVTKKPCSQNVKVLGGC